MPLWVKLTAATLAFGGLEAEQLKRSQSEEAASRSD